MYVSREISRWLAKNSKAINVKEMKEFLESLNDELFIGFRGHYGEFYPLELRMIHQTKVKLQTDHTFQDNIEEYCVIIEPPDMGPEPD